MISLAALLTKRLAIGSRSHRVSFFEKREKISWIVEPDLLTNLLYGIIGLQ